MAILIKYGDAVRSFESADAALGHTMMLDRKQIKYTVTPDATEPRKEPKCAPLKCKRAAT